MTMKHLMIALLAVACIGSQAFAAEASSELNVDDSFPIIFYGLKTNDQALATAKEWGATYVHRYGSGRYIERDQNFFDMAEKHGLKVMADLRARYWTTPRKHGYVVSIKRRPLTFIRRTPSDLSFQ